MGYSPWGCRESDTAELLTHTHTCILYMRSVYLKAFEIDIVRDLAFRVCHLIMLRQQDLPIIHSISKRYSKTEKIESNNFVVLVSRTGLAVRAVCKVASVLCDSFATPWTAACQAPLSMGFSRQEYWSGLPCPPPGDLPDPESSVSYISCIGRQVLYHYRHLGSSKKPILFFQSAESGLVIDTQTCICKSADGWPFDSCICMGIWTKISGYE